MANDDATGRTKRDQVSQDHAEWLRHGIEISCSGVDPATGVLEIGVRSPVAAAEKPLRRKYGEDTHVYYANVIPAGRSAQ